MSNGATTWSAQRCEGIVRKRSLIGEGRLGILGGMGSEATAHFLATLARRMGARVDQDHVPFLLVSCPEIGDRSQAILAQDDSVPSAITEKLLQLTDAGCGAVTIPCNTAHYWRDAFRSIVDAQLIDIVDATAKAVSASGAKAAIVLGTRSTMQRGIYDTVLCERGVEVIRASDEIVGWTTTAISLAKAGESVSAWRALQKAIHLCKVPLSGAIVLACTELPMLLPNELTSEGVVDSDVCLADACIQWWNQERAMKLPRRHHAYHEGLNEH